MQLPLFALPEEMQMRMFKANPMAPVAVRADHRVMLYVELAAAWDSTALNAPKTVAITAAEKFAAVQSQSLPTPSDSSPSVAGWSALPTGLAQALSNAFNPDVSSPNGFKSGTSTESPNEDVSLDDLDSPESPDELIRHTRAAMNALCEISGSDWEHRHDIDMRVVVAAWSAAADRGLPLDRLLVGWLPAAEVSVISLGVGAQSGSAIRLSIDKARTMANRALLGPWYRVAAAVSFMVIRSPLYAVGWLLRRLGMAVLFVAFGFERLGGAPLTEKVKENSDSSSDDDNGPRIVMVHIRRPSSEGDE